MTITATDKDGKEVSVTFEYAVTNPSPTLLPVEKNVLDGTTVRIPMSELFTDPDGDDLSYSIEDVPAALGQGRLITENGVTYLEIAIDNSASQTNGGSYEVEIEVDDGEGGVVSNTATINVTNPGPVDHALIEVSGNDGDSLTLSLAGVFTDPDGDDLSYTITSVPDGLGTATLEIVNGIPQLNIDVDTSASQVNAGLHDIIIEVDDGEGGTAEVTYQLKIGNPAPQTTGIPDQGAKEGESISINVAELGGFTDEDKLTYKLTGLPDGFEIDPDTGEITGTFGKTAAKDGPYTVTITATDKDGTEVTTTFEYGVSNIAPTVTEEEITGTDLIDGQEVSISTAQGFTDEDGDTLEYGASGLPDGLSIDPVTGEISGTLDPSASVNGPYEVVITATDENGETVRRVVTLGAANTEITSVDLPDTEERIGEKIEDISVDIFEDQDGDTLDISVKGLPDGVIFDPVTKTITGIVAGTVIPGDFEITVTATDNEGSVSIVTFIMTVPEEPVIQPSIKSPLSPEFGESQVDDVFTNRPSDVLDQKETEIKEGKGRLVLLDSLDTMLSATAFSATDTKHATLQLVDDVSNLQRHIDKVVTPDYVQVIHVSVSQDLQGTGKPLSSAQVVMGESRILYYLNANEGVNASYSSDAYIGGVSVSGLGAIVVEKWVDSPFEVTMEVRSGDTVEYLTITIDPRIHNAEIIAAETRAALLSERLDWMPALY